MNISPISPATFVANHPGQSATRQIVITDVVQEQPSSVELSVTVSAAGNDPVTAPVTVNLDPEDATPTASVSLPADSGLEATVSDFGYVANSSPYWVATLTITTV